MYIVLNKCFLPPVTLRHRDVTDVFKIFLFIAYNLVRELAQLYIYNMPIVSSIAPLNQEDIHSVALILCALKSRYKKNCISPNVPYI